MQHVVYSAQRSLTTGVSAGQLITYDLPVATKQLTRIVERRQLVSLGNRVYTTYHHARRVWDLTTTPLTGADRLEFLQFLDSVEDGQTFSFGHETWSTASPLGQVEVVLDTARYQERRAAQRGGDVATDAYTYSFSLREVT